MKSPRYETAVWLLWRYSDFLAGFLAAHALNAALRWLAR